MRPETALFCFCSVSPALVAEAATFGVHDQLVGQETGCLKAPLDFSHLATNFLGWGDERAFVELTRMWDRFTVLLCVSLLQINIKAGLLKLAVIVRMCLLRCGTVPSTPGLPSTLPSAPLLTSRPPSEKQRRPWSHPSWSSR